MDQTTHNNKFVSLPGAIIIAGAIIALAIIWIKQPVKTTNNNSINNILKEISIRPVSAEDHILGNPNAQIKIVTYSDTSCPICKTFDVTMAKVMDNYGASGKVAWIYRHFPLDKPDVDGRILHKNAGHEAQALECAAAIGGNDKFWTYEKKLYQVTPSVTQATPQGLDQSKLPEIASSVGLDKQAFIDCLDSGKFKDKVEEDYQDGINAGIEGTPYSIIITPSGNKIPVAGALPFASLKAALDALLAEK